MRPVPHGLVQGQAREMEDPALTRLAQHRQSQVLEAVASSARDLLRAADAILAAPLVLERVGIASGVDRTHLFVIDGNKSDGSIATHRMWSAQGAPVNPVLMRPLRSMVDVGLGSWMKRLTRGETIMCPVREAEASVRPLLECDNVKSTLCVPVFSETKWLGFMAFDDCQNERDWSAAEVGTIRTLAELFGAALSRASQIERLAVAKRIVESSPTILFRVDPQPPFRLRYLSQNVSRYGYDAQALITHAEGWQPLIDPRDRAVVASGLSAVSEGLTALSRNEFRMRHADGSSVWFESRSTPLHDDYGTLIGIEGLLTDITERRIAADMIAQLARSDPLTGLANRKTFTERLELEFARARRDHLCFAVHYLDLDRFKDVNDTLGHPVGDRLLKTVAERLRGCVRETDLIARFGGDEFAILQSDVGDAGDIETLATKVGNALGAPYTIAGNTIRTTASIGIASWAHDIDHPDTLMAKADLALYRAKHDGRNKYRIHAAALDNRTQERLDLGEELRLALSRHEFTLHYQPQIDLASGKIAGLEALVRWNHPVRGMLLPGDFIPIAETNGTIAALGDWVIEEVCRQIEAWTAAGIAVPVVAINMSAAQFRLAAKPDESIAASLSRHGIAPQCIEIELTEKALLETAQRQRESLERLRALGLRLSIDAFGTGASSLTMLRGLGIVRLKIDGRFIADAETNADHAALVRGIIALAQALSIDVLAEDIETVAQRDFLVREGCKLGQGYWLGRPLPAHETVALLGC